MRRTELILVVVGLAIFVFLGVGALNTFTDGRAAPHETLPFLLVIAAVVGAAWFFFRKIVLSSVRPVTPLRGAGGDDDSDRKGSSQVHPKGESLRIVRRETLEQGTVVVSTEDVPLDNRYGSSTLTSEHEFTHTATSRIEFDRRREIEGHAKGSLWSVLEAGVRAHISRGHSIEVGKQITRRVTLKFEAAPGKLVRYRVAWKQNLLREVLHVDFDNQIVKVPYSVTHGLFHSVESVAVETF